MPPPPCRHKGLVGAPLPKLLAPTARKVGTWPLHSLATSSASTGTWEMPGKSPARRDLSFPPLKCTLNAVLNDRSSLPFCRKCFAMPLSIPRTHSLRSTICVDQREFNQPTIINWVILNCTKPPVRWKDLQRLDWFSSPGSFPTVPL